MRRSPRRRRHHRQAGVSQLVAVVHGGLWKLARTRPTELSRVARRRLEMLTWHEGHGRNVARTARYFGDSRATVDRWLTRSEPGDLASLEDRSSCPRRRRRPTWTTEAVEAVREVRERYPRWGKAKLAVLLRRAVHCRSVSMAHQSCDGSASYPCIQWPTNANGYSITVRVYRDNSLSTGNLDLKPDIRKSWAEWNAIAAVNPFYEEAGPYRYPWYVYVRRARVPSGCLCCAETDDTYGADHMIQDATITFDDRVTWNHTYTYDVFVADSRKVATHELGHSEGLGHTGYTAVMHQGPESFWKPQSNDVRGIQHIYPLP